MYRLAIITGVALVLGLAVAGLGGPAFGVVLGLASGWLTYPARVLPRVRVAWDGVATGVVCLALFTVGLHRTLGWFYGEIQRAGGTSTEGRKSWSMRWTASLVVLIVLMFVVGISATAVVHQAGWLIASRRSLVEERRRYEYGWGSSFAHLREIGMGSAMLTVAPEPPPTGGRSNGQERQSWMTDLLPGTHFVIGGRLRRDLAWDDPRNSAYFKGVVPIYLNPEVGVVRSPEGYALAHYAGNVHVLDRDRALRSVGPEEASNTILAGEVAEGFKPWGNPANLRDPGLGVNQVAGGFGGPSGSGANFLFVDGSVRFFRGTTSRDVLRRLSGPRPPDR